MQRRGKIIDGENHEVDGFGVRLKACHFVFFFTGGSFHAGTDKIRAKFGDIRCRKSGAVLRVRGNGLHLAAI